MSLDLEKFENVEVGFGAKAALKRVKQIDDEDLKVIANRFG